MRAWDTTEEKELWTTTIINNGYSPDYSTKLDQIDLGGGFGVDVMFDPANGRLLKVRDRIFVIFAHYNFFGYYSSG